MFFQYNKHRIEWIQVENGYFNWNNIDEDVEKHQYAVIENDKHIQLVLLILLCDFIHTEQQPGANHIAKEILTHIANRHGKQLGKRQVVVGKILCKDTYRNYRKHWIKSL